MKVWLRPFEEKLYELFLTRPMPGSMHQYNGQEVVAAGVCAHLNRDDYVTSTHRGHGHCIAKGVALNAIMAEEGIYSRPLRCGGYACPTRPLVQTLLTRTGVVQVSPPFVERTRKMSALSPAFSPVSA